MYININTIYKSLRLFTNTAWVAEPRVVMILFSSTVIYNKFTCTEFFKYYDFYGISMISLKKSPISLITFCLNALFYFFFVHLYSFKNKMLIFALLRNVEGRKSRFTSFLYLIGPRSRRRLTHRFEAIVNL